MNKLLELLGYFKGFNGERLCPWSGLGESPWAEISREWVLPHRGLTLTEGSSSAAGSGEQTCVRGLLVLRWSRVERSVRYRTKARRDL